MNADQIEQHLKASPFRPIRIQVTDGRSFEMPHREFMWRHPTGRGTQFACKPRTPSGNEFTRSIFSRISRCTASDSPASPPC